MEFVRKLVLQTQAHLRGLAVSQRLAIGLCVALIIVALLWLADWASRPDLVPLLDQPMTAQELGPIQQRLDVQRIKYRLAGDVLMVPAEARPRLLAQLGEGRMLPNDISIGFARLMEESSPWLNMEEQAWRRSVAQQNELARVLREFNGVQDAKVFLDRNVRRTIGQTPAPPTASIFVKMAPGMQLDREKVFALASFVSRAVAGLDVSRVAVTDATTGRSHSVPNPADAMAFDNLEDRQKKEEYFAGKIRSLLANIPGLLVAVHAELDVEVRRTTQQTFGRPVQLTDRSETVTQDRGPAAGGPGVVPNASRSVAVPVERMEKSVTESTFDGRVDSTVVTSESPRHGIKSLSASVNVPRGYLASIYRQANDGDEPTDEELQAASVPEIEKIHRQVMRALNVTDDDAVVVDWFHDEILVRAGDPFVEASSGAFLQLVQAHGGKVGIAALAVGSLFMMLMMIRRAGEGPIMPEGDAMGRPGGEIPAVPGGATRSGAARSSPRSLGRPEEDEAAFRSDQVAEQVSQLVREDPQSSAGILQRWMETENR